jgi:peptidoglycan/LPS O-acetylase OafA/YrhL
VGAYGAILLAENPAIIKLKAFQSHLLQLAALAIISVFVYFSDYGKMAKLALPLGNLLISISILFLILCYIKPSNSYIYKFLNSKIMIHIGVLSYSLYVWQEFFTGGVINSLWRPFPYNLIMIYCVSLASYYLLEQPILKLKKPFITSPLNPEPLTEIYNQAPTGSQVVK